MNCRVPGPGAAHAALVAFMALGIAAPALAETMANEVLLAPLATEHRSRLSLPMPASFAADQKVWVAYEVVALSKSDEDGEIGLEQAFDGVMMPASDMFTTLDTGKLDSHKSGGTLAAKLEQIAGQRSPAELKELLGADLYTAYEAVNAGNGRVLTGRVVKWLPPPGKTDAPLLVSVERAEGIQPLAVRVVAGQGSLPAEFAQKPSDSVLYKLGYLAGLSLFGWLVMRFVGRRDAA